MPVVCVQQTSISDMRAFAEAAERKLLAMVINTGSSVENLLAATSGTANATGMHPLASRCRAPRCSRGVHVGASV
jgi:hypothetical protein